jgi:hypothetical protein
MIKKMGKSQEIHWELMNLDFNYLAVRLLYFSYLFVPANHLATHLIDAILKLYLKSISRSDLIKKIKGWGLDSHNTLKILNEIFIEELGFTKTELNLSKITTMLENMFQLYRLRYFDQNVLAQKNIKGDLADIHNIDNIYKLFRDKIRQKINSKIKNELIIEKFFELKSKNEVFPFGEELNWVEIIKSKDGAVNYLKQGKLDLTALLFNKNDDFR